MLPIVSLEKQDFLSGSFPRAHNANDLILWFGINHHDDSGSDGADSNEARFFFRMFLIVDFQKVNATSEKLFRFFEGQTVLLPIGLGFTSVSLELHSIIISQRLSKSMDDIYS